MKKSVLHPHFIHPALCVCGCCWFTLAELFCDWTWQINKKLKSSITLLAIDSFWIFWIFHALIMYKDLNLRLKMFLVHKCYLRSQALGCNVNGIRLASNRHWISSSFEKNTKSDLSRISRTFLWSLFIMLLWFTVWLKC